MGKNYLNRKETLDQKVYRNRRSFIFIKSYLLNVLIVLLISIGLSIIGVILSDVIDLHTVKRYLIAPQLFLLNAIPLSLLMLVIYHLTSRIWVTVFTGGGLFLLVQLVNHFKMDMRQEPLTPSDFLLGMEAATVVKLNELPISLSLILMLLFFITCSILLAIFVKSKKISWQRRIAGIIIPIATFILLYNCYYKDVKLYNSFPTRGSKYSTMNQFKSRGFIYSFLVKCNTFKFGKPNGYTQAEAEKLIETYQNKNFTPPNKLPNIIAVMGEAFFDIDRVPGIEFNDTFAPLANFNHIKAQSYSGRIVTSIFGGGTANTEFAFLTGHSLSLLNDMTSPYMLYLRKDTFSLTRVLEKYGYATMALHAGDPWFYNRFNVYDYFGFDSKFFKTEMDPKVKYTFGYISDMESADFMLDKFRTHLQSKPNVPFFDLTINIENHGPYSKDRLGNPDILKRTPRMDDATYNIINNYVNGVSRCDKALGYMVENFEKMNEPIVFVYFGDHLPYLGDKHVGYTALGYKINQSNDVQAFLNQYETPYFIWSNSAAKELLKNNKVPVLTGPGPEISVNYLPTELLKYIGLDGGSYFNYLAELKKTLPIITHRFYKQGGKLTENLTSENKQLLEQYRRLQYYMMMDKKAITP